MNFFQPTSFSEAVALASACAGPTRFLAGGTDVLVQLRAGAVTPNSLIDIKRIEGAQAIAHEQDGSWTIGAAVSGAQMSDHPGLCAAWPGVVEAMDLIGSTQVQGRATLAGNLCNGSPAADSVPALMTAGAWVRIIGPHGERDVPVAEVPTGPGTHSLGEDEVVMSVHLPAPVRGGADAYQRFIPRTEMDIAVVGCGISLQVEGKTIVDARVALGAVAPTARLVPDAAKAIVGTQLDNASVNALAEAASAACDPIDDKRGTIAFRTHVAGVLAKRVAHTAYDRARSAA